MTVKEQAREIINWANVDPEINAIVCASVSRVSVSSYIRKNGVLLWTRFPGKNERCDN